MHVIFPETVIIHVWSTKGHSQIADEEMHPIKKGTKRELPIQELIQVYYVMVMLRNESLWKGTTNGARSKIKPDQLGNSRRYRFICHMMIAGDWNMSHSSKISLPLSWYP